MRSRATRGLTTGSPSRHWTSSSEMRELAAEEFRPETVMKNGVRATHRFTVRRHRDMWNSVGRELKGIKRRLRLNTAHVHPGDLADMGISSGDTVRLTSAIASVDVIVEADDSLRTGIVSLTHGFGLLPEDTDYLRDGAARTC